MADKVFYIVIAVILVVFAFSLKTVNDRLTGAVQRKMDIIYAGK